MRLLLIIFFLISCEDLIYEKYTIINSHFKSNDSKFYKVKKGENLYSISRKTNAPLREILIVNNIQAPYKIYPNQKLIIPKPKTHLVKKGDTLYSISRKYQTDIYAISKINKIKNLNALNTGQKLIIPRLNKLSTDKNIKKKKTNIKIKKSKQLDKIKFKWPLKGKIIARFGSDKPGFHNDGINIISPPGKSVTAAMTGKVIYIGNEIPGYGNLILLKHSKNWITAYAHLKETKLIKGSVVKQGQIIGTVGKTGNVNKTQLHFEIRRGKVAVDPLNYLS